MNELSGFAKECAGKIKRAIKGLMIEEVCESKNFVHICIGVDLDAMKVREVDVAQSIYDAGIDVKYLGGSDILIEKSLNNDIERER